MRDVCGDILESRYRVLESTATDQGGDVRVEDTAEPGRPLRMTRIPLSAEDRPALMGRLEAEARRLSWLRHPHIDLPWTVFVDYDSIRTVGDLPRGEILEGRLLREWPSLTQALRWVGQACVLYRHLHTAPGEPIILGRISLRNFVLTPERQLQLIGFRIDRHCRLEFEVPPEAGWSAPETPVDARSDVYCLGMLLQRLIRTGTVDRPDDRLLRVILRATQVDPTARYGDVLAFKFDLEQVARELTPPDVPLRAVLRPPVRPGRVLGTVGVLLAGAGIAWGVWGTVMGLASSFAMARTVPVGSLGNLPEGTPVWVRGQLGVDGARLKAPLSGAWCVGYSVLLRRQLQREVFDTAEGGYRPRTKWQTLIDRAQWRPFHLTQEGATLQVMPGTINLTAPSQSYTRVPSDMSAPLAIGEHVLAVQGTESRADEGDVVSVHGTVSHDSHGVTLTATDVLEGNRLLQTLTALAAILPQVVTLLISIAVLKLSLDPPTGVRLPRANNSEHGTGF